MNKATKTPVSAVKTMKNKPVHSGKNKPVANVNVSCLTQRRQTICQIDAEPCGYMDLYIQRRRH